VSRLVQLKAARRPTAASHHSTSERRALRSSSLRRGSWPSCCVHSVAPGSVQSCTAAHSRLASLHLGASRLAQLADASRHLAVPMRAQCRAWFGSKLHGGPPPPRVTQPQSVAPCASPLRRETIVPLRAWRRAWSSSKLYGGPQPPRVTPPRSVAPCAARRCVAGLCRPATCGASRLVQLKAAWRPTAASRHSTSERRVLRSSPLRRGPWPSRCVKSVALSSVKS